jgi:hypothetical protein
MTEFRYPLGRIVADCSLFGGGAVMSGIVVALAPAVLYVVLLFGGLTGVFLLYTMRTALRHRLRIAADAEGMNIKGARVRSVKWAELEAVRLRYYSTRRSRKDGWMTLRLKAGGPWVEVDSHLEGFETLARLAAEAAIRRGLALDQATRGNLSAMGLMPTEPAS